MRALAIASVAWLALAGIALATLWPSLPSTSRGWLLLLAVGPPAVVVGEFVGALLIPAARGDDAPRRYGWKALAVAIALGVAYVAALLWMASAG